MGEWIASLSDWVERNTIVVWVLLGVSIVSVALVALLLPGMVARLPADYFASSRQAPRERPSASGWVKRIGKNVLGFVFLLAGIAMVLLPGQGVLTILIGVFLLDFPGKHAMERWIVRRKKIKALLDRMREKRGQPPLQVD
jgi:4-hydroxybenzoate polyprenyltransferase